MQQSAALEEGVEGQRYKRTARQETQCCLAWVMLLLTLASHQGPDAAADNVFLGIPLQAQRAPPSPVVCLACLALALPAKPQMRPMACLACAAPNTTIALLHVSRSFKWWLTCPNLCSPNTSSLHPRPP